MAVKSGLDILEVIQTGTIRQLGCGFVFAFRSNYGSVLHHFLRQSENTCICQKS